MKIYHKSSQVNRNSGVSALGFVKPKSMDLTRTSGTIRDEVVICKKCLAKMRLVNADKLDQVQRADASG